MGTDNMPRTLKVRAVVTLIINRDEYDTQYGEDATASEIRDHIKGGIYTAVNTSGIVVAAAHEIIESIEVE
jgi:hypothetical protein